MDILPAGAWFGLTRRRRRIIALAFATLIALCLVLYIALRIVFVVEAHRAASLLSALSAIQIGQSQSSALLGLNQYEAHDYVPEGARGGRFFRLDPWRLRGAKWLRAERFDNEIRSVIWQSRWRRKLGLRTWMVQGFVSSRVGNVQSVSANVAVEGHDEWLMATWSYAAAMDPRVVTFYKEILPNWQPEMDTYFAHWAHLHMGYPPFDTGGMIENLVTPEATADQLKAARTINLKCLTSTSACHSLCDLMPEATRYRQAHHYPPLGSDSRGSGPQGHPCQ